MKIDTYKHVTPGGDHAEWQAALGAIDAGHRVQVSEELWYYFLEVLPPRAMIRGGFVFAEGYDQKPMVFVRSEGAYWVERTPAKDLREMGIRYSVEGD